MSLVPALIHAAINAGSPSFVRDLKDIQVLPAEEPLYRFTLRHIRQHRTLPSVHTLQSHGFELPRVREPASYYLTEVRNRHIFNCINQHHEEFANAMRGGMNGDGRGKPDAAGALSALKRMIQDIGPSAAPHAYSTLAEQVLAVKEDFDFARVNPGLRGVTFGFPTLDASTLGAVGGDLIVVAGRPGMGKSQVLIEMAYHVWLSNLSSCFISMEMSLMQIARRWVGRHSGINPKFIRSGELSPWARNHLYHAIDGVAGGAPVHFLAGDMDKSVEGIEAMALEFDPEIIYVDAAYFLVPSARKRGFITKWEQISEVVKELKQLAVKLNRPIIITVQLNRNVKPNENKPIDSRDVGGSDSIPQDANVLVGLRDGQPPYQKTRRVADIIKSREGETGSFAFNFRHSPMDFSECEYVEQATVEDDGKRKKRNGSLPTNPDYMM